MPTIVLDQENDPNKFWNPHSIHTTTGDGRDLIVLSGVLEINLKGRSADHWNWCTVYSRHSLPIPDDKHFKIEHGAPIVTLSSISNNATSYNAGYSVEWFHLLNDGSAAPYVTVRTRIGVADIDGFLNRLGYQITLVGQIVEAKEAELI